MEILKAIWEGIKKVARVWGRFVNTVLLSIVYVTVFGLMALFALITGQDLLGTRSQERASSLWGDWERKEVTYEDCLRQS